MTIGELTLPSVGAAQITQVSGTVTLPANPPGPLASASTFNVGIIADSGTVESYLGSTKVQIAAGTPLPATAKPDVTVASLQPLDTDLSWSMPFRVKATIQNEGAAASGPLRVSFLLVDANRPDAAPLAVADAVLDSLQPGYQQDLLQTIDLSGKVPVGVDPATIAGRVVVQVDPENAIDEANESNNDLVSGPVVLKLLTREGRTEVPKPGQVITAQPQPATPPPTTTPPTQNPLQPPLPTREQRAEQAAVRRALFMLKVQQNRLRLQVFRDRAEEMAQRGPHFRVPRAANLTNSGPRAS